MANRITNQQIQQQLNQQQQEIQNLTAVVNNMAQNIQDTQAAIQQLLANQGNQGVQPPQDPLQNEDQVAPQEPVVEIPPLAPVVPVQAGIYTLEKFIKNGAKTFKGTVEPEKAEAWTLNMLKTFRAMQVPEAHWVRLASCVLEEEAAFWWEAAQRTDFVGRQIETITWAEFIEAFNVTYYPEQVREQKAREFVNLKQENQTVREFEQKFIQLERFAPGLCVTEKARTNKFVWALRFTLKERVASHRPRTLAEAVATAFVVEEVLTEQYGPYMKREKNRTEDTKQINNKRSANGKRKDDEGDAKVVCPKCKKTHAGECMKGSGKCFQCGESGHIKKNCPKLKETKE